MIQHKAQSSNVPLTNAPSEEPQQEKVEPLQLTERMVPTFNIASNDTYEYEENDEEEEEDFSWYQIQDVLQAVRGYTDDPNTFDPEGWSVYWDEETWEYYNEQFDFEHPEADKNDTLFIDCIKGQPKMHATAEQH